MEHCIHVVTPQVQQKWVTIALEYENLTCLNIPNHIHKCRINHVNIWYIQFLLAFFYKNYFHIFVWYQIIYLKPLSKSQRLLCILIKLVFYTFCKSWALLFLRNFWKWPWIIPKLFLNLKSCFIPRNSQKGLSLWMILEYSYFFVDFEPSDSYK